MENTVLKEFKDFINKGGVFEAAVGLIMALAFAPVVQGMVDHLIMPIVARIFGQPDFSNLKINLGGAQEVVLEDGTVTMVEPAIAYGAWLTIVVSFILIAMVIFALVKAYNKAVAAEEEEDDGPSETDLLVEIRDLLAKK